MEGHSCHRLHGAEAQRCWASPEKASRRARGTDHLLEHPVNRPTLTVGDKQIHPLRKLQEEHKGRYFLSFGVTMGQPWREKPSRHLVTLSRLSPLWARVLPHDRDTMWTNETVRKAALGSPSRTAQVSGSICGLVRKSVLLADPWGSQTACVHACCPPAPTFRLPCADSEATCSSGTRQPKGKRR